MYEKPLRRASELASSWLSSLRDRPVGVPVEPQELSRLPGVEVLNDVVLNQVLFRVPGDTEAVIDRIRRDGTCWLGGMSWRGAPAIRFSVSGWPTTEDDIRRSVAIARAIGGRYRRNRPMLLSQILGALHM
jgi:hypothetical protein